MKPTRTALYGSVLLWLGLLLAGTAEDAAAQGVAPNWGLGDIYRGMGQFMGLFGK